jgi:hypothetical protein
MKTYNLYDSETIVEPIVGEIFIIDGKQYQCKLDSELPIELVGCDCCKLMSYCSIYSKRIHCASTHRIDKNDVYFI